MTDDKVIPFRRQIGDLTVESGIPIPKDSVDVTNEKRVTGYLRTHFTCPHCKKSFDVMGVPFNERVQCTGCWEHLWFYDVREFWDKSDTSL